MFFHFEISFGKSDQNYDENTSSVRGMTKLFVFGPALRQRIARSEFGCGNASSIHVQIKNTVFIAGEAKQNGGS